MRCALWLIPFLITGLTLTPVACPLAHVLRTADIHEELPPLPATVPVWEVAAPDVVLGACEGASAPVRALFVLGAPASVTLVARWEFDRLRTRRGAGARGARRSPRSAAARTPIGGGAHPAGAGAHPAGRGALMR